MTAAWMLWTVAVAALVAVAARALEEAAHLLRLPLRWVWGAALAVSAAAPLLAHLVLRAAGDGGASTGAEVGVVTMGVPDAPAAAASAFSWTAALAPYDGLLLAGWAAASVAVLLSLLVAAVAFAVRRRGWRATEVDGHHVLLTRDLGPAVAGLLRGRIVLPEWALEVAPQLRTLMLEHEAEHVRAGDPRLLGAGLILAALFPWNPVAWWQLRRLRLAIEVDCDARVLRRRPDPLAYGNLLLEMGARGQRAPLLTAAAFSEPRTTLETRILRMTESTPRARWVRIGVYALVGAGAVLAAAAAPAPDRPLELPAAAERAPETAAEPATEPATEPAAEPGELARSGRAPLATTAAVDTPPTFTPFTDPPRLRDAEAVRELLRKEYPPLLKDAGIGGSADVWLFITAAGTVQKTSIKETSGYDALDEAALRVAGQMAFEPARNNGKAVDVWVSLKIAFASEQALRVEDAQGVDLTPPAKQVVPKEAAVGPPKQGAVAPPRLPDDARIVPPLPDRNRSIDAAPQFTPFEQAPRLTNRSVVQQALQSEYPPLLRDAGISGSADVWFFIDETGRVVKVQLNNSSGYDAMDAAVLRVANLMTFTPAKNKGEPVQVWVSLKIEFKAR